MIRVVGLGSPFGDDQVGWRVIEHLQAQPPEGIDLVALDRPGAALLNWMADTDHLILIDAVLSPGPAGQILAIDPQHIGRYALRFTTHDLKLPDLLQLAERLGLLPAQVEIYGITVGGGDVHRMQPCVALAMKKMACQLKIRLAKS